MSPIPYLCPKCGVPPWEVCADCHFRPCSDPARQERRTIPTRQGDTMHEGTHVPDAADGCRECFGTNRTVPHAQCAEHGTTHNYKNCPDCASETVLGTNPKDLIGVTKVPLHLVPAASIIYQAQAMEDGARKYGPYNWRKNKVIASVYIAAAMRHLYAYLDGEDNARDSKVPHIGHALSCLGIMADAKETGNLIDDRPTPGAAADLLELLAKKTLDTGKGSG